MVEVVHNQEGKCSLHISSSSGNLLFESRLYTNKEEAEESIRKLKQTAIFERSTNTHGKFIINLKTQDGTLVGQSKLYSSEAGMENGIQNLRRSLLMP